MVNNRYNDKKGRYEIKTTTIETADQAVFDYFDKKLALKVDSTGEDGKPERRKVNILFAAGERWSLIRKNNFRDENNSLILPIISIRRTDMDRTPGFGGMAQETPEITVSSVIHQKTANLQNMIDSRRNRGYFPTGKQDKVVREYLTLPFPDFATVYYEIIIWTQYHTQMNEILEKIYYNYDHMDSFVMPVEYDGVEPKGNSYYFVGFREGNVSPQENTTDFTDQERILKYTYNIKTPIYLMMNPKDEALAYGQKDGVKVAHKYQSSVDLTTKESVLSLEDYEKLFG